MCSIELQSWLDVKKYIDEHFEDYPDLSWMEALHHF